MPPRWLPLLLLLLCPGCGDKGQADRRPGAPPAARTRAPPAGREDDEARGAVYGLFGAQHRAWVKIEERALDYCRDPRPTAGKRLLYRVRAYHRAHPGFALAGALRCWLAERFEPARVEELRASLDGVALAAYRHFFEGRRPEQVEPYFFWNAVERCLVERGAGLPDAPPGNATGPPPPPCPGELAYELDQRPADHGLFMRLDNYVYGSEQHLGALSAAPGVPRDATGLLELLGVQPGMVVADVGAGLGTFTFALARLVGPEGRVLATEADPVFAEFLRERAGIEGASNVEVRLTPPDRLEAPPGSLDAVLFSRLLAEFFKASGGDEAVQPPYSPLFLPLLRSIHRALKPGGQLYLLDDYKPSGREDQRPNVTLSRLLGYLREAGFRLERHERRFMPYALVLVLAPEAEEPGKGPPADDGPAGGSEGSGESAFSPPRPGRAPGSG